MPLIHTQKNLCGDCVTNVATSCVFNELEVAGGQGEEGAGGVGYEADQTW